MSERKMGTMVQPVNPANFLYNMAKIFTHTGNTLTPSRMRTPFGARHESTGFCGWVSSTRKGPVHIPTGKGPVHIPNRKWASSYPQLERGWSIFPTGKVPCKKCGLGLRIKSGTKRCPALKLPPSVWGCFIPIPIPILNPSEKTQTAKMLVLFVGTATQKQSYFQIHLNVQPQTLLLPPSPSVELNLHAVFFTACILSGPSIQQIPKHCVLFQSDLIPRHIFVRSSIWESMSGMDIC